MTPLETGAHRDKHTHLETIPEGWDYGSLSSFWNVTDCKHVTAPFVTSGFPLASIRETQSRIIDLSEANKTTEKFYLKMIEGGRKPEAGDLIFSRNATVGEVAQVTSDHPSFAMGQDVCLLRKRSQMHSTDFLQFLIKSSLITRQISDSMVGSTFKRMNVAQIKALKLVMPPPNEQQAIAAALSDADGAVAGLERLIAKKRLVKQGAMQDLLSARRRLPGFSGEWEVKKLGELVTIIMGQSPSSSAYNLQGDGLPLIQGNADINDRRAITRVFTRDITKLGKAGDYLMTVRAPVGEIATTEMDVCLGRGVCALRTDQRIIYHIMIANEQEWAKLSKGSTFDSVNGAEIRAFEVLSPTDAAERLAVTQVLDDMDIELQGLEARLAKARAVKEGMMQNLLTGRVRLV
jgi:type I restriction enzyme S subunit